jgi:hypothetical protein
MTEPTHPPSAHIVDDVAASVAAALADLDRHESVQTAALSASDRSERVAAEAIRRLEHNLSAWQGILSEIADTVRSAHDDLAVLDMDLKGALDAFAVARKHLQNA